MDIDRERMRQVAFLARIELSDEELDRYAGELSRVLEYVEQIDRLGLEDTPPLTEINADHPDAREDKVGGEPLTREQALAQAPVTDGTFFLVPPVVEYPE
jgi:aspartyl-tRNA(Asn)/glutamyl-tRNA(Gln) amidotransferase subunit C